MIVTKTVSDELDRIAVQSGEFLRELMGRSVLVTGATGFIGSYLIGAVMRYAASHPESAEGTEILAVVRDEGKAAAMLEAIGGESAGFVTILTVKDIAEPFDTEKNIDYIIHCASNAGPKEYMADPVGTMMSNLQGTRNMLELAVRKNVRKLLYVSTIEVYGRVDEGLLREDSYGTLDALNPRSCYPISKKACENLCVSFRAQFGANAVIGRLSYIYGPGMKENDSKVVACFPKQVAAGEDIVLKSAATQRRSFTYIGDAVSGLLCVLVKGEPGEAYNIAADQSVFSIRELAEKLVRLAENGTQVRSELPDEQEKKAFSVIADAVMDNEKTKKIGFAAVTAPETGLARVLEHYREKG